MNKPFPSKKFKVRGKRETILLLALAAAVAKVKEVEEVKEVILSLSECRSLQPPLANGYKVTTH